MTPSIRANASAIAVTRGGVSVGRSLPGAGPPVDVVEIAETFEILEPGGLLPSPVAVSEGVWRVAALLGLDDLSEGRLGVGEFCRIQERAGFWLILLGSLAQITLSIC